MSIAAYSISESDIKIKGGIELASEGSIVTKGNSNPWTGPAGNVLNNAVQGAGKVGKDSISAWLTKKQILPNILASTAFNIISGGTSELIKYGINLAVGSFFGKMGTPTTTTQDLRFKTNGTAKFEGSITTPAGSEITPVGNLVIPGTPTTATDHFLPSFNEPLGAWNLKRQPIMKMSDMIQWQFIRYLDDVYPPEDNFPGVPGETLRDAEYRYYRNVYLDESSIQVSINPSISGNIEKYETSYELINYPIFNKNSNWREGYVNNTFPKIEGELIYNDTKTQILRHPRVVPYTTVRMANFIFRGGKCVYNPNLEYTNRVENANYVVKVTVILYPKHPYNRTPIVMTRSYLPKYEIVAEYQNAMNSVVP